MLTSINPVDESIIEEYAEHSPEEINMIVDSVADAWKDWSMTSIPERTGLMQQVAGLLRSNTERYAQLITLEMGKPVVQARAEVEKCASVCD